MNLFDDLHGYLHGRACKASKISEWTSLKVAARERETVEMQMQLVTVQQASWPPLIARIVLTSQVGSILFLPSLHFTRISGARTRVRTRSLNNAENAVETAIAGD